MPRRREARKCSLYKLRISYWSDEIEEEAYLRLKAENDRKDAETISKFREKLPDTASESLKEIAVKFQGWVVYCDHPAYTCDAEMLLHSIKASFIVELESLKTYKAFCDLATLLHSTGEYDIPIPPSRRHFRHHFDWRISPISYVALDDGDRASKELIAKVTSDFIKKMPRDISETVKATAVEFHLWVNQYDHSAYDKGENDAAMLLRLLRSVKSISSIGSKESYASFCKLSNLIHSTYEYDIPTPPSVSDFLIAGGIDVGEGKISITKWRTTFIKKTPHDVSMPKKRKASDGFMARRLRASADYKSGKITRDEYRKVLKDSDEELDKSQSEFIKKLPSGASERLKDAATKFHDWVVCYEHLAYDCDAAMFLEGIKDGVLKGIKTYEDFYSLAKLLHKTGKYDIPTPPSRVDYQKVIDGEWEKFISKSTDDFRFKISKADVSESLKEIAKAFHSWCRQQCVSIIAPKDRNAAAMLLLFIKRWDEESERIKTYEGFCDLARLLHCTGEYNIPTPKSKEDFLKAKGIDVGEGKKSIVGLGSVFIKKAPDDLSARGLSAFKKYESGIISPDEFKKICAEIGEEASGIHGKGSKEEDRRGPCP